MGSAGQNKWVQMLFPPLAKSVVLAVGCFLTGGLRGPVEMRRKGTALQCGQFTVKVWVCFFSGFTDTKITVRSQKPHLRAILGSCQFR